MLIALPESEKDRRLNQLEREMTATREYLQARIEEHEAVKEELKSAREEVLSANEELTITNDELRNRNRELAAINAELEKARGLSERARVYADAIVGTVREALLIVDDEMKVLRANRAFYRHFGGTPTQTEGLLLAQLKPGPWNDAQLFERLLAVVNENTEMNDYELPHIDSTGAERTLLLNARKIPAEDDRAALILLAIIDSTAEKTHADALRIRDERLRAAVDAVQGIVWTNNAAGQMEGEQPDWAALTGQTYDQYRGFGWAQAVHPADIQPTIDAWQETLLKQEPFLFEHRIRRHDGEWRHYSIRAVPVFNAAGVLQQWVGVHTDVTDLRRLVRERTHLLEAEQSARTAAESANRVKDEFLATLSHELRTPITIVVGWSRLLLKKHGNLNEDLAKGLNLIANNSMMQAQIISDLLDMSSIVTGKTILNVKATNLRDCVIQSVEAQQLAAKEKKIELSFEEDADGPRVVLGDVARLQQVFGNLLTNALKFTPTGGRVTVGLHTVGDTYEVSVEDTGEGISADFLPQVFGRFRQADESGARIHGGLGLGLAIVKQLIEMHGGSVRAHSAGRGRGARFTISLAARVADGRTDAVSETLLSAEHHLDNLNGTKALVVEDNVAMLEFLIRILEESGALVLGVRTADAALEALSAPQGIAFNLLLSDIGLPGLDGYELMRRVRNELKVPPERLPAIAVTAFGRKEDRQHALEAGFQAHLPKPYEVGQLLAIVRRISGAASMDSATTD